MRWQWLWGVMVTWAALAAAQDAPEPMGEVALGTTQVALTGLGTVVSAPFEPLDAFVIGLAPRLRRYSASTGWEIGGWLCRNVATHQTGVVVQTIGSQMVIPFTTVCPPGMMPLPMTLHTHPGQARVRANAIDAQVLGVPVGTPVATEGASFSAQDYHRPGYLVTPDRVLYQQREGSVRVVE